MATPMSEPSHPFSNAADRFSSLGAPEPEVAGKSTEQIVPVDRSIKMNDDFEFNDPRFNMDGTLVGSKEGFWPELRRHN